jgi:hypothetical protein
MTDQEKALVPVEQKQVIFYEDEITAVLVKAGDQQEVYVPLRPICDLLGIDWRSQYRRIQRDPVLSKYMAGVVITTTPDPLTGGGGPQITNCLLLDYLNGWLFGIDASRVKPEVKQQLIRYQEECYRVLANAFLNRPLPTEPSPAMTSLAQIREMGLAIVQMAEQQMEFERRMTTSESRLDRAAVIVGDLGRRVSTLEKRLAPGNPITDEQAAEIQATIHALAMLLTEKDSSKNHFQGVFTELHRRFGVTSYKLIPQSKYEAVLTFLAEWRDKAKQGGKP